MSESKELYIVIPEKAVDVTGYKVPAEVYSRIVGYLRPIQNWNEGKQQEFADRKTFTVPTALEHEPAESAPAKSEPVQAAFDAAVALPVIEWFYARVCELAEARMVETGKVEGQHWAAMQKIIETLREETKNAR